MLAVVPYAIPDDVECFVPGWPRLKYFVTPGIGCADIRNREEQHDPFFVIPQGVFHGIYNNQ